MTAGPQNSRATVGTCLTLPVGQPKAGSRSSSRPAVGGGMQAPQLRSQRCGAPRCQAAHKAAHKGKGEASTRQRRPRGAAAQRLQGQATRLPGAPAGRGAGRCPWLAFGPNATPTAAVVTPAGSPATLLMRRLERACSGRAAPAGRQASGLTYATACPPPGRQPAQTLLPAPLVAACLPGAHSAWVLPAAQAAAALAL
jgi:hypothetical protein